LVLVLELSSSLIVCVLKLRLSPQHPPCLAQIPFLLASHKERDQQHIAILSMLPKPQGESSRPVAYVHNNPGKAEERSIHPLTATPAQLEFCGKILS
jgi:hypothetical protein